MMTKKRLSKFGGWGAYTGEMSHYWTWTYRHGDENKPRKEQRFYWRSFCATATGGPDPNDDAPFEKPFPKRAGRCYTCFYFAKG